MGKLLSLLARDNASDCCGPKSSYDIFLDFENAQPSENELEVYQEVSEVLLISDKILEEIQVYKVKSESALIACCTLFHDRCMSDEVIERLFSINPVVMKPKKNKSGTVNRKFPVRECSSKKKGEIRNPWTAIFSLAPSVLQSEIICVNCVP